MDVNVKILDKGEVIDKLKELQARKPSMYELIYCMEQRRAMKGVTSEHSEYEVMTFVTQWRVLCERIWGKPVIGRNFHYDRAKFLKLAQIIAHIALLRYNFNVFKNARAVIAGRSGIGKTTYAMLAVYGAFRILGCEPDEAWSLTASLTFMNPVDFAEFMVEVVKEDVFVPALIIDEAGLALSKYWVFQKGKFRQAFTHLLEVFDLIKDWIGMLILTTPNVENVAKRLRDICDYKIYGDEIPYIEEEAEEGKEGRKVVLSYTVWAINRKKLQYYTTYSYPHRRTITKSKLDEEPIDIDVIPATIKLPSPIWSKHLLYRKEYVLTRLEMFIRLFRELEEELLPELIEKVEKKAPVVEPGEVEEEE